MPLAIRDDGFGHAAIVNRSGGFNPKLRGPTGVRGFQIKTDPAVSAGGSGESNIVRGRATAGQVADSDRSGSGGDYNFLMARSFERSIRCHPIRSGGRPGKTARRRGEMPF